MDFTYGMGGTGEIPHDELCRNIESTGGHQSTDTAGPLRRKELAWLNQSFFVDELTLRRATKAVADILYKIMLRG